jgi:VWFA-related protein
MLVSLVLLAAPRSGAQQAPVRASVDLIVADVQVVDADGRPVSDLTADRFEVSIDGKKLRVAIADFLSVQAPVVGAAGGKAVTPRVLAGPPDAPAPALGDRVFIIAIDNLSFSVSQSARLTDAARVFVGRLQPGDLVGLFTYPTGPQVNPTTDHAAILQALARVSGAREQNPTGRFQLRASEIVDLATAPPGGRGGADPAVTEVITRECGTDQNCIAQLLAEARSAAQTVEASALVSLGGLRNLLQGLRTIPGRKMMVLLTAGMVASDRAGGHPDVSELSTLAGQDAARSDVLIYSVFVDQRATTQGSAERRSSGFNRFTSSSRDGDVLSRWFQQFSGTAGGTLITDQIGDGEFGFDRIFTETSAYYRLGIEPTDAIRDGKPHQIKVTVANKRVTVRARKWVVVPAK